MDASKVKQLEEQGTNGLDGLSSHGNGYSENSYEVNHAVRVTDTSLMRSNSRSIFLVNHVT